MERIRLLTPPEGHKEQEREKGTERDRELMRMGEEREQERVGGVHTRDVIFGSPQVHDIQRSDLKGEVNERLVHAGDGDSLKAREGVDERIELQSQNG
jgi:hypothetical protein